MIGVAEFTALLAIGAESSAAHRLHVGDMSANSSILLFKTSNDERSDAIEKA